MGVHLHHRSSSGDDDSGRQHSIASLRAKFENLAHDAKDGAHVLKETHISRDRSHSRLAAHHVEGQAAAPPAGRPTSPIEASTQHRPSVQAGNSDQSRPAVTQSVSPVDNSNGTASSSPVTIDHPSQASMDKPSSESQTQLRSSSPSEGSQTQPLPIAARYASMSPAVASPASSFASELHSRREQGSSTSAAPGVNVTGADQEHVPEPQQFSVSALRDRFGKSSPVPQGGERSQSHSRRPSIEAYLHPGSMLTRSSSLEQNMRPPERPSSVDQIAEPTEPVGASAVPPRPDRGIEVTKQAVPVMSSEAPPPLPPKQAPTVPPKPKRSPASSSAALPTVSNSNQSTVDTMSEPRSASPSTSTPPRKKGPAPPPPISRSASPAVTDARQASAAPAAEKPTPHSAPSKHRPAPPPPRGVSPAPVGESVAPTAPTSSVPAPPIKPPLPVRKPTLPAAPVTDSSTIVSPPSLPEKRPQPSPAPPSSSSSLPTSISETTLASARPPLPGNKPSASSSGRTDLPPPPGPSRSRAQTVSRAQCSSPRPPLPVRQGSVSVSPVPVPSPSGSRHRAQSISADGALYMPPPPPMRTADGAGAALKRGTSIAVGGMHVHSQSGSTTPSRRNGSTGDNSGDEDEDEGAAPPLTPMAQRLLDEHPVNTDANRRPPHFTPDVRIASAHSISAFAVWGAYACVAHTHVKVYDTNLGSQILEIDQHKDTGLDSRAKEPRITALGFRPAKDKADEGRYLWCGNKDGHIFEVDIKMGAVTAIRSSVHGAPVTHIMRHQQWVVTLDEAGKLHVWEVLPGEDDESNFKISRTMRISDKMTFAKMIRGRLWTATAPAVRSTTNAAGARGPTIRVYDVCARGSTPPPMIALTSEWTGAATSATLLADEPEKTFMGHEGGFVSIWTIDKEREEALQCIQVLKVSTTDILALEGADRHLWAGNRRGDIHVWNLEEQPWRASNIWTAHPEQAVQSLTVDPFGIKSSGRFIVWSASRDDLHGWDGLRGVNWIDKRMVERQPDYCDFRQVQVLVVSWNIDSAKPADLWGSTANTAFLQEVLSSVESPTIIVFGFQETIPLTDKKLTAKALLFGSKGKDGSGATSDRVSGAYRAWADKLSQAVRSYAPSGVQYTKVHSEQLVGLFTCMFVKSSEKDFIRDVDITTVKRGIGGIYGNKGAIVARMVIDDTSMCFINVHLAAGQKHKATRNADIAAIMEQKVFPPADRLPYVHGGDGSGILDHEMVVLNGDLNYRIDLRRDVVVDSIAAGELATLLDHDQLRREMRGNHAFRLRSFAEAPITFNPTYKYDRGTDEYDSSEKRRIPAWCDRILFTKTPRITPTSYQSYATTVSDHKPVSAGLAIELKRIDPGRMRDVYRETQEAWKQHEAKRLAVMIEAYSTLY